MIDKLIAKGPVGRATADQLSRFSTKSFSRLFKEKFSHTVTRVNSPLTGVQINAQIVPVGEGQYLTHEVVLEIPLQSVLIGHNLAHSGPEVLQAEIRCASLICRTVLAAFGFSNVQITRFRRHTEIQLIELTWHTETASPRARDNLVQRTMEAALRAQKGNSRHDILISDVEILIKNGELGLLITLKNGNQFRQYPKVTQVKSNPRKNARIVPNVTRHQKYPPEELDTIKTHVRNEAIVSKKELERMNIRHPDHLTEESVNTGIKSATKWHAKTAPRWHPQSATFRAANPPSLHCTDAGL